MPFMTIRDIPVIGDLVGLINLDKDAEDAFSRVVQQGGAKDWREYGLFLRHALKNGYLSENELDDADRQALNYILVSPSTVGRFVQDVATKVPEELTFGLIKSPQVEFAPEHSTASSLVAGALAAIPQVLLTAGVGGAAQPLKAIPKLAALGGTIGTVRAAAAGRPQDIPEQAATEAAMYAATGAIPAALRKIGIEKAGRKVAGEIGQKLRAASQARLTTLGALRQAAGLEKTMLENEINRALKRLPELTEAAAKSHERIRPFTQVYRMISPQTRSVATVTPEGVVNMPEVMTAEQAFTAIPPRPAARTQIGYLPPVSEPLALPERTVTGLRQDALLEAATRLREQLTQRLGEITQRLRPRAEAMMRHNPKLWRDFDSAIRRVAEERGIPYEKLVRFANMNEQELAEELARIYSAMTEPLTLSQRRASQDILSVLQSLGMGS